MILVYVYIWEIKLLLRLYTPQDTVQVLLMLHNDFFVKKNEKTKKEKKEKKKKSERKFQFGKFHITIFELRELFIASLINSVYPNY